MDILDVSPKVHDKDLGILAGANDSSVVTLGTQHPAGMPMGESEQLVSSFHVEDFDVCVVTATNQAAADTIKVEAAHETLVSQYLSETFSRVRIPNTNNSITTGRGDESTVFGELTASKSLLMARKLSDCLSTVDVPEPHREVTGARHNRVST